MTNYNDGNWHGWNGGDCPVHPESMVTTCHLALGYPNTISKAMVAGKQDWENVIAFRVTKEHKELREYWVNYGEDLVLNYEDTDNKAEFTSGGYIHMREVE